MWVVNLLRRPNIWPYILAIVLAILGGALTYILSQDPEPKVTIETISDVNVLDLRRSLQGLDIVFRDQNLQEQNLNLRIVAINVLNSGEVDILHAHYDPDDEWGFRFNNGEVVEARLIDASSEYLQSKVDPQPTGVDTVDTVVLPKVTFDVGAYFTVEILLLHSHHELPSISSIGKISGIDKIDVLPRPATRQELSFLRQLFQGSALVHLGRIALYGVGWVVALGILIFALVSISDLLDRRKARKRRMRILRTQSIQTSGQSHWNDFLVSWYEIHGYWGLTTLRKMVSNPDRFHWSERREQWFFISRFDNEDAPVESPLEHLDSRMLFPYAEERLKDVGILERGENDDAIIDPSFHGLLRDLMEELKE